MSIDLGKSVKLKGNFLSERKLCRIVAVFIVAVFVAVQFSFVVFVGEADACSDALRAKNTRISDSSSTGTQICEDGETEKCVAPNSREQHTFYYYGIISQFFFDGFCKILFGLRWRILYDGSGYGNTLLFSARE